MATVTWLCILTIIMKSKSCHKIRSAFYSLSSVTEADLHQGSGEIEN